MRRLASLIAACAIGALACADRAIEAFPDSYAGVGVELTGDAAGYRVVRVADGGGAAKAGLAADDVVLSVGGEATRGQPLADVVERLRGAPGTTVDVLVRTKDGERTLTLTRQAIAKRADDYAAR